MMTALAIACVCGAALIAVLAHRLVKLHREVDALVADREAYQESAGIVLGHCRTLERRLRRAEDGWVEALRFVHPASARDLGAAFGRQRAREATAALLRKASGVRP